MRLADHGYRVVERDMANFLPLQDDYLASFADTARTQRAFARFSRRDSARLPEYLDRLKGVADVLRALALKTPPGRRGLRSWLGATFQGRDLIGLPRETQRDALRLFTLSAREFLDDWFESEPVKALFGFDATVGNYASPDTPGSAYLLLHHVFGEVNGRKGAWGHSVGGMGAITQAMARACRDAGIEISLETPVAEVLVDGSRTAGVRLESGEEIAAPVVVSNVGPALLYSALLAPEHQPPDFRESIANWKAGSGTFRMNVALSELPDFAVLPGKNRAAHHAAGIVIAPSLD
jgi:phytoene dehydrogenase-like protein